MMILYHYVPIVARERRVRAIQNHVQRVRWLNIAIDCQIAHRPQHKKACKKRAAELHDEKLFKQPPPPEDCPICMLPLPISPGDATFQSCCGKTICDGCIYRMAMEELRRGRKKVEEHMCAFCRTPAHNSNEEEVKRLNKIMDTGNAMAHYQLGGDFANGTSGMRQDWEKVGC